MTDKKHVLRLSKDCFNPAEISQEYFSPLCEFSATNEYLSSTEYFSPTCTTPKTTKKEFAYETPNSNAFETPKKIFERNVNNDSPNSTFVSEIDFTRPKYYNNNVSPAIEKIMRKMKMPTSSTPERSQTPIKRVFSPNYHFVDKANEDPAICALVKKRLEASFSSPKAHAIISRIDSPTLKATREVESPVPQIAQTLSKCQESVDSDNEIVVNSPRYKEIIYVSEMHFLLMASNRNRRMRSLHRPRSNSRDSAFSEGSDQE